MKFADQYVVVGVAQEDGAESCVVLMFSSGTKAQLPESMARKLADDILRNANYLWPIKEDTDDAVQLEGK